MPPTRAHSTRGAFPWTALAAAGAVGWALLVAASPPNFFAWATPYALCWLAASARAAPALGARLRPRARDLALGVAVAALLYAGSRAFLWAACGGVSNALCAPMGALFDRFRTRAPLPALALLVVVAPAEELFWRGVALPRLLPRLGPARAVLATTALPVALALATREPFLALATLPTFAAWGALSVVCEERLPAPLLSHALWSACIASIAPPV